MVLVGFWVLCCDLKSCSQFIIFAHIYLSYLLVFIFEIHWLCFPFKQLLEDGRQNRQPRLTLLSCHQLRYAYGDPNIYIYIVVMLGVSAYKWFTCYFPRSWCTHKKTQSNARNLISEMHVFVHNTGTYTLTILVSKL